MKNITHQKHLATLGDTPIIYRKKQEIPKTIAFGWLYPERQKQKHKERNSSNDNNDSSSK